MKLIGKLALTLSIIAYGSAAFAIPRLDIDVDTSLAGFQTERVVVVGAVFDVEIHISQVTGLFSYRILVEHDQAILVVDATAVTEGPFLSNVSDPMFGGTFFSPIIVQPPPPAVAYVGAVGSLLGPIPGASGSGMLFTIQYTALATGISPLQFTVVTDTIPNIPHLVDDQFNSIAVDLGGARIIVRDAALPSTLLMLGIGLAGLTGLRRRNS